MNAQRILSAIRIKQVWVNYDMIGYQVMAVRSGRRISASVPVEPANRAYRQTLEATSPHPDSFQFPWWLR